jgi:dTMP kinase
VLAGQDLAAAATAAAEIVPAGAAYAMQHGTGPAQPEDDPDDLALDQREGRFRRPAAPRPVKIYPYGVNRDRLEEAVATLRLPVTITKDLHDADVVMTLKNYYRRSPGPVRDAEGSGKPVFILKSNTTAQIQQSLETLYALETANPPRDLEDLVLRETQDAINRVLRTSQSVELPPQNAYIRRLQHQRSTRDPGPGTRDPGPGTWHLAPGTWHLFSGRRRGANVRSGVTVSAGKLITFEGPEGSGKSTQVAHLCRRLEHAGVVVLPTREPGGTPVGRELRAMLLVPDRPLLAPSTEALLMCADRAQHVAEVIRPALAAGMVVVCDRYADSTLAYQGFGSGVDLASLQSVVQFATGRLRPDLTVLLDLDVRVGLARRREASRAGEGDLNRIDLRDVAYHQRVRDGFLTLARREPKRFLVVDAAQAPEVVADRIWARVSRLVSVKAEIPRLL